MTLPKGVAIALVLQVAACSGTQKPLSPEDGRRHPDGIAVDPLEHPPDAVEEASAADGVVALRTPLGPEAAKETTRSFLLAVSREDLEGLRKLMTTDATSINPSTRARESSFYFFSRRFGRLDYFFLSNVSFWQEERVELYRANEGDTLWSDTVGPTASPASGSPASMNDALEPSDVIVRVPLSLPRTPAGQLLGEEVTLLLRRSGGRYVVHRVVEDFTLPP
ncbi:MAG: hypothetical protein HOW73_16420 [Polyangiaceae bacterium]|nr:hypothetical protein [Polyangiaceae bacterium]